jgi:hypothetical protein
LGRQTGTHTHTRTSRKSGSTANSYRFAHALISRWRLISEASLPVFRRNRGGEESEISHPHMRTGKKTPGGAGTETKTPGGAGTHTGHTGHTGHADAQRHTDESHNQPNPPTTHTPHVSATTEAAADSTAAGPEPTAPRGRLRSLATPSKPDPASTRSQSASPRLLESGRRTGTCRCGVSFTVLPAILGFRLN